MEAKIFDGKPTASVVDDFDMVDGRCGTAEAAAVLNG